MNNIRKNRLSKIMIAASLSFTIAYCASPQLLHASVAQAATLSTADRVIETGKQFLGTPYQFGAQSGNTNAFDCSSFTQYVFKQNGISLPRSSEQQATSGTYVSRSQLQPGDLIFTDTNQDGEINHVSIYIGNGQLLHTYKVGIDVTVSDFEGSAWDRTYVTARRVLPATENKQMDTAAPQPSDQAPAKEQQPVNKQKPHYPYPYNHINLQH